VATGTYSLVVDSTGMCLTTQNGATSSGTLLVQSPSAGTSDDLWNVTSLGNGQYNAIGVQSGRSINVIGNSTGSGSGLQLYDYNGATDELFTLEAASTSGYYNVVFVNSGLPMAVQNASTTSGADIDQETPTGGTNEMWQFHAQSPAVATGYYGMISKSTGMAVHAQGDGTTSGTLLVQSPYDGSGYEQWILTSLGNGQYEALQLMSGLSINVMYDSSNVNETIQLYPYSGTQNELFTLVSQGGGYYNVDFVNSGLAMAVLNSSTTSGADIVQNTPSTASDELWTFIPQEYPNP
jgi:hypothetical protein